MKGQTTGHTNHNAFTTMNFLIFASHLTILVCPKRSNMVL